MVTIAWSCWTGDGVEVIDDVRSIIAKSLKIPIERLTPDARLDEIGAESLDVIEIVFDLEEKFNISIPFKADEGTSLKIPGKDGQEDWSSHGWRSRQRGATADRGAGVGMNRVVVTGIGVVSPVGSTRDVFWSALVEADPASVRSPTFPPSA